MIGRIRSEITSWALIGTKFAKKDADTFQLVGRHHFGRSKAEQSSVLANLLVAKPELQHDGSRIGIFRLRMGNRSALVMQLVVLSDDGRACLRLMTLPIVLWTVADNTTVGHLNNRN